MTANHTYPEPGPNPAGASITHRAEALAEAAWRHLVNRHTLARLATSDDPAELERTARQLVAGDIPAGHASPSIPVTAACWQRDAEPDSSDVADE